MNTDDFENKLLALTRDLRRPDPTAGWKSEILARAMRAANQVKPRLLPPRWLVVTWSVAWAAAIVLDLAAPRLPITPASPSATALAIEPSPSAAPTLLAYNRQFNITLDPP